MNKDLIKYGLILVGAYLVYRYVQDHGGISGLLGTGTPVPTPASVQPGHITTTNPPPATTVSTTPTASLKDRIAAATPQGSASSLNLDEWCWFFAQVSGKPCPDPDVAWPAVDRTQQIDINGFWNLVQSAGLGFISPAFQQTYPSWLM